MSVAAYGALEYTLFAVSSSKMLTRKFLLGVNPRCERGAQSRGNVLKRALIVTAMIFKLVFLRPKTRTEEGDLAHPVATALAGSSPSGHQTWSVSFDDLNKACPDRIHIIASERMGRPSLDDDRAELGMPSSRGSE
eukprot:1547442-Pyramimonas_sp.AAC.1